jgi:hypothetical protein
MKRGRKQAKLFGVADPGVDRASAEMIPPFEDNGYELIQGLPFLDIHLVRQDGWDELVGTIFATDRRLNPKGMIEVVTAVRARRL